MPLANDDVFVLNGHTITIDTAAVAQNVTVNTGGVLRFATATARSLAVGNAGAQGNVTIQAGATLDVDTASNVTHTLSLVGNLANSGTLNLATDANSLCNTTFSLNGNQTVSGAGATTTFNRVIVNMGATENNILDVTATNFAIAAAGYLTITNGTFRLSADVTIVPFDADPALPNGSIGESIPANGRFWLNSAGATVNVARGATDFNLTFDGGTLQITSGTMNIGAASDSRLRFTNTAGSKFQMDGGALTISGRWTSVNAADSVIYNQSGGTLTVGTVGNSLATFGPFFLGNGASSSFTMSGGSIVIVRASTAAANEYDNGAPTSSVTGGTIQIGTASTPAAQTFNISTTPPVWDFTINTTNNPIALLQSALTVRDDLTIGAGSTLNANNLNISVGNGNSSGNWTNSGTFTAGTGTVTFTGTSATPTIGGASATTFNNFVVNKASNNLSIATTPTINGVLTFTSGDIVTGANRVILGVAATVATPSASSYVFGTVQKNYSAAGTFTYPVGDASNYTPVTIQGTAGFTAGNLAINTTGIDHPQVTTPIPSTGIDASRSVNRYWTLVASGLPVASVYNATFNFINASPVDRDAGTTTGNFIVQRYDGSNWNPTTLGTAAASSTSITGVANVYGDFAIGEVLINFNGNPGAFNAFETTTPAGSILGRLYTKLTGTAFTVSIVAVTNNAVNASPSTTALTVDVIDASPVGGTLTAASNCRTTWTTVIQTQTVPAAVAWVSGRINVTIIAPTRAVRNARIRVTQGVNVGCSTDNFTIRPTGFTITSSAASGGTAASQTGSSGVPAIKTGASFNLTAASVIGYDGTPVIDNTKIVGTPIAGAIGGVFTAASVLTGTATGNAFYYSEVGNVGFGADAVFDSGFSSVDQSSDCVIANTSNVLSGGKYGCSIGSIAVAQTTGSSGFGRFIPDNFAVSLNSPQFASACASGSFTYVGQPFNYTTAPVITVTARNGTNNGLTNATTTNYAGAYVKLTNANLTPATQAARYASFDALGGGSTPALNTANVPGAPLVGSDPVIGTFTAGVGTLTFSSGTGLAFTRSTTTPSLPFNADIALTINIIDGDGVNYAGNPATFGAATAGNGITFSGGKEMRFGRMRLNNAFGSTLLDLPLPLSIESYASGGVFSVNSADNCTTLLGSDLRFSFVATTPNLTACETAINPATTINFVNGKASSTVSPTLTAARLIKPGSANNGSVDIGVNLNGVVGTIGRCTALGAAGPTATNANKPWLQGNWGTGSYNADPAGRATFGLFKSADEFIYLREVY